jgi:hypothetical protein
MCVRPATVPSRNRFAIGKICEITGCMLALTRCPPPSGKAAGMNNDREVNDLWAFVSQYDKGGKTT